jgi:hypothetical protein
VEENSLGAMALYRKHSLCFECQVYVLIGVGADSWKVMTFQHTIALQRHDADTLQLLMVP